MQRVFVRQNAFLPKNLTLFKLGWERLGYLAFCPHIRHRHAGRRLLSYRGAGVLLLRGRMLFINHSNLAPLTRLTAILSVNTSRQRDPNCEASRPSSSGQPSTSSKVVGIHIAHCCPHTRGPAVQQTSCR